MEQINNEQTIRECSKVLGHQVDTTPQLDTSRIILTAEVNPKLLRRSNLMKNLELTNATAGSTIYTTPTNQDFYLTAASLSLIKDVTSTSTYTAITAYIDGTVKRILNIAGITLTPQNDSLSISINPPIRIDKGTIIALNNQTNVANISTSAVIYGYLIDTETTL